MPPPVPGEARAADAGGIATSVDDNGSPRFIWATERLDAKPGATAEDAARDHFSRFAAAYGIEGQARAQLPATMDVASVNRTRNGDYVVQLTQQLDGIDLYRSDVKVVMRADMSLIALSGTPSRITGAKPADAAFSLTAGQALSRALGDLYSTTVPDASGSMSKAATGKYSWLELPAGGQVQLSEPARSKQVFYRTADRLVAAYFLEFYSSAEVSTSSDAYRYLVAAADGRVLERRNLTQDVAFTYRVFADADAEGRPLDGPIEDFTPHPTGTPDGSDPAFVLPNFVTIETTKSEPAGAIDPWLAASAVQSLGNNVDAYADLNAPDGYSNQDRRATTTAPLLFNRVYNTAQEPLATAKQTQASVTNLFYVINWLHDYWYDSGFTEAAANGQDLNFGRGGEDRDAIRAEAQDFGGLNNANMSTPSDGFNPRMQMYLWSPPAIQTVTVEPGGLSPDNGSAGFGVQEFDLTAELALADDGTAPNPNDGCTPITNDVAGRIALIDRGTCPFQLKAFNAEQAGAVGMLLANNVAGPPPNMGGSGDPTTPVTIPSLSVSLDDGANLKTLLGQGVVTVRLRRQTIPPGRDGSLDNMIVAHEWGHYFHHRLSDCGALQCAAMSEGWGDFMALHTALREGDDLDGTYGAGIYGPKVFGDTGYFGIRRFPYSVDFTKNALTFGHIQNAALLPPLPINGGGPNSEVHNAGEVWTSMLFQAYVELQKNPGPRTFAEVRRAFSDYVVLGLQMVPTDATYTEMRDAILAAITILNPDDLQTAALAFARRGAGSCAVSPPRNGNELGDLAPVVESFDVQPSIAINSITIDDSVDSCDSDGTLDAGETGLISIEVANKGPAALIGSVVSVSTTTPGVSFPGGASTSLGNVAPFQTQSVTFNVALDDSFTEVGVIDLTITVNNPTACVATVAEVRTPRVHADEVLESSAVEDVEATSPPWSKTGDGADVIWTREQLAPTNHAWHGADSGSTTDAQLVSPALEVSATGDFTISFEHAYSFEADTIFWDGGVIEISSDGGASWQDISGFADPGYNATITDTSGNPLGGRAGFGASNAGFPALETLSLNLGTALAGQTVQVRFRIGTDVSVGAPGWTIDNLSFGGIDNTPFTSVVADSGECQEPPIADAGIDRAVNSGSQVILDGTASADPNGDVLSYMWTQIGGRAVSLVDRTTAHAAFQAPEVTADEVLGFQVQVSDSRGSSTDTVVITVAASGNPGDDDGDDNDDESDGAGNGDEVGGNDDSGGCSTGGSGASSLPFAMVLGLAFLAVRRRRR